MPVSREPSGSTTRRRIIRATTARIRRAVAVILFMALCATARSAAGAAIFVTTVEQKISADGGCSLQEAIFSANFDSNVAIASYNVFARTTNLITTGCVAGSGDDIIVLPSGGTLLLSKIVDDAENAAGPTATPRITSRITILAFGATLQRTGTARFRLFTVGPTGHLTIRGAYIKDFSTRGGDGGAGGGGGGLAAGSAQLPPGNNRRSAWCPAALCHWTRVRWGPRPRFPPDRNW